MASEGLGWDHPCGHCYWVLRAPQAITDMIHKFDGSTHERYKSQKSEA